MRPLLKWPGGKTGELKEIISSIPPYARYLEPFLGGGAVYFALAPARAAVNDLSLELMRFYCQAQAGSPGLRARLQGYAQGFAAVRARAGDDWRAPTLALLDAACAGQGRIAAADVAPILAGEEGFLARAFAPVEAAGLLQTLCAAAADKLTRTARLHEKRPMPRADLEKSAVTGYLAGCYLHARAAYNRLNADPAADPAAQAAAFFFVREYCYGAMFRYNRQGAFNIPYGGASYNGKDFAAKARAVFAPEARALLGRTAFYNLDFADFLREAAPAREDFIFLDPPYDTAFSDYAGNAFTMADQARLAALLRETPARFLLVIKDTPRIRALYEGWAHTWTQPHQYTYNVRGRNAQGASHLYVKNYE